jgi:hypothetical protein
LARRNSGWRHITVMDPYIKLNTESADDLSLVVRDMVKKRSDDVDDYNNLPNRFMSGRKVGKIPTSSTDVVATDNIGDFNYTSTSYYLLINTGTTAEWRKFTLNVF